MDEQIEEVKTVKAMTAKVNNKLYTSTITI